MVESPRCHRSQPWYTTPKEGFLLWPKRQFSSESSTAKSRPRSSTRTNTAWRSRTSIPAAPTHLIVIPKREIASVDDATPEDEAILGHLFVAMRAIAAKLGLKDGYRVVTNCGRDAGQEVMHLHFHLLAGRRSTGRRGNRLARERRRQFV